MTVAIIHQPEYFPWTHLFEKIIQSDIFVILDSVQYSRRSFQNRNMIFSTNGPKWISIPIIKSSRDTIIKDIKINNKIDWQSQHKKIIFEIYKKSKYYSKVINIFENVFIKKWESLAE